MVYVKHWENCSMAEAMQDLPVTWTKMVKDKKYCQYLGLV